MPHWAIKSAVQRAISWLPNSHFWNGLFQKWVTKSTGLTPGTLRGKLEETCKILSPMQEAKGKGAPFRAFEVGTGWYPTIPVALYLCGASDVWTTDINPLLNRERLERLIGLLLEMDDCGELRGALPDALPDRIARLRELRGSIASTTPGGWLEQIGVHTLTLDARHTGLPDGSVDLFFSSGVLEYIPRSVLGEIFRESARLASPDFVNVHRVNLVDQYSSFDKSITPYHFLQFSPRQWAWVNSPLIWQSRLRISDYRELLAQEGFAIAAEENISGDPADLAKVKLAPEFAGYSEADLLVIHSFLVARKASAA